MLKQMLLTGAYERYWFEDINKVLVSVLGTA